MTRLLWMMLAVAAALAAQVPGMGPWWDSPLARDLNLSDDQQKQIRAVVRESRPRMIQLRAALETAEAELGDLMNDDPVDARKTSEAIERDLGAGRDGPRRLPDEPEAAAGPDAQAVAGIAAPPAAPGRTHAPQASRWRSAARPASRSAGSAAAVANFSPAGA